MFFLHLWMRGLGLGVRLPTVNYPGAHHLLHQINLILTIKIFPVLCLVYLPLYINREPNVFWGWPLGTVWSWKIPIIFASWQKVSFTKLFLGGSRGCLLVFKFVNEPTPLPEKQPDTSVISGCFDVGMTKDWWSFVFDLLFSRQALLSGCPKQLEGGLIRENHFILNSPVHVSSAEH